MGFIPGTSVQRFLISGPDLAIAATANIIPGTSVHRFSISSLDLRIDVAKRSKQGQSVHRFPISSPDLRINASAWLIPGDSPIPPQADSAAETAPSPAGRVGSVNLSTRHKKKSPDSSLNRDSRSAAATYSPTWCSSTIGASELNFSVRDGKRWILTAITAAI